MKSLSFAKTSTLSLYNKCIRNRGSTDTPKQTVFRTFGKKGKRDKDMKDVKINMYLSSDSVRSLCMKHDFYTCGDIEQYHTLLNVLCNNEPKTEKDIELIAHDIVSHSATRVFEENECFDYTDRMCMVMGLLLDISYLAVERKN